MEELTAWAYKVMIYPWDASEQLITILLYGKKPGEGKPRPEMGAIHFHADGVKLHKAAYETGGDGRQLHVYHMPITMYHAVLTTLREDESVQVRLLALDYLAAHSVDRNRIRELLRDNRRPGDEALMVRLAQHES